MKQPFPGYTYIDWYDMGEGQTYFAENESSYLYIDSKGADCLSSSYDNSYVLDKSLFVEGDKIFPIVVRVTLAFETKTSTEIGFYYTNKFTKWNRCYFNDQSAWSIMSLSNIVDNNNNREGGTMFLKKPDFSKLAFVQIAFTSNYATDSSIVKYFYP